MMNAKLGYKKKKREGTQEGMKRIVINLARELHHEGLTDTEIKAKIEAVSDNHFTNNEINQIIRDTE